MIQPLRRAHRAIFMGLALSLPALLVAAHRARRPGPVQALRADELPGLVPAGDAGDELVYWSAAAAADRLPPDAELVGSVRAGALLRAPPPGRHAYVLDLAHGTLRRAEQP